MSFEVTTKPDDAGKMWPCTSTTLTLKVKAPNDAVVILSTSNPTGSPPCYEIYFGTAGNTTSLIQKDRSGVLVSVTSPSVLNEKEFVGLWVQWNHDTGEIFAGRQDQGEVLVKIKDPNLKNFPITNFGVCTRNKATGSWLIDRAPIAAIAKGAATVDPNQAGKPAKMTPGWVAASKGYVPQGAIIAGFDKGGETVFVARAVHGTGLLPGKLVPSSKTVFVCTGGKEHQYSEYEVLCGGSAKWTGASGNKIPRAAIKGGYTETGEILFIGRGLVSGHLLCGRVQESTGLCYIPFCAEECTKPAYEILTF